MDKKDSSSRAVHRVSGTLLFRFAIVADTHIRLPGVDKTTPWHVNTLSNERSALALRQVKAAQPKFVVHLGDVVHPVPELPTYVPASELASHMISQCELPFYFVPGNHDVGDKKAHVTPAHQVNNSGVELFERLVGPSYRSFDEGNVHLVIINSSLIGSGLPAEERQRKWLEADLAANRGARIFLFSHYPLFLGNPDEPSLYDNVEQPGRRELLALMKRYNVEAVFSGHVHNFFYHNHKGTEMYTLPSTSFVRHDYSEIFDVPPEREFGRDDTQKVGWAEVEVYSSGHVVHVRRSLEKADNESFRFESPDAALDARVHVKHRKLSALGVHLREPYADCRPISFNSPIEEFTRRRVRNDYVLLGLWETGIRDLRIPAQDLCDALYRPLVETLVSAGHRLTVFFSGLPSPDDDVWRAIDELDAAVELILDWKTIRSISNKLFDIRKVCATPLFLASVVAPSDHRSGVFKGGYQMSFGFDTSEIPALEAFHAEIGRELGCGYTFRISPLQSPLTEAKKIAEFARQCDTVAALNVVMANDDVAIAATNEARMAGRVAETMIVGAAFEAVTPFIDTYMDQDRGYFPRIGLYDRSCNPRSASRLVKALHGIFHASADRPIIESVEESDGAHVCSFAVGANKYLFTVPLSDAGRGPALTISKDDARQGVASACSPQNDLKALEESNS